MAFDIGRGNPSKDKHCHQEYRCGEEEWPKVGQYVQKPWRHVDYRDSDGRDSYCNGQRVLELQKLSWDVHGSAFFWSYKHNFKG